MEKQSSRERILALVDVKKIIQKKAYYRQCKQLPYKNVGSLSIDILKRKELSKIRKRTNRKNEFFSSFLKQ
jgi:hypothetical protein